MGHQLEKIGSSCRISDAVRGLVTTYFVSAIRMSNRVQKQGTLPIIELRSY